MAGGLFGGTFFFATLREAADYCAESLIRVRITNA